jgi:hypothetical protein
MVRDAATLDGANCPAFDCGMIIACTLALDGFNMPHTIAESAGKNNARGVNCEQIRGEQATAGKDWD